MDVTAGNCEVLSNAYMGALRLVEQLQECSWDEHILRCQVHGIMWSKVQLTPQQPLSIQLSCRSVICRTESLQKLSKFYNFSQYHCVQGL